MLPPGRITPNHLLSLWVGIHGSLDPRLHPVLREQPEIQHLVGFSPSVLYKAFSRTHADLAAGEI